MKCTKIYFDTNVFDHIHKKIEFKDSDLENLVQQIRNHKLTIFMSILNLEEILPLYQNHPTFAKEQLKLVAALTDSQNIFKYPNMVLTEEILAFVNAEASISPFLTDYKLVSRIRNIISGTGILDREILSVNKDVMNSKEKFHSFFKTIINDFLNNKNYVGFKPTFDQFLNDCIPGYIQRLAEHGGLPENCNKISIEKLRNIRSINIYVSIALSWLYTLIFEKRQAMIGDSFDLRHAVLAEFADIFVTNDNRFKGIFKKIENKSCDVMNLKCFRTKYLS